MAKSIKKTKKSILNLGGIAKGRKVGVGSERKYTKRVVSKKITIDQKACKELFKGVRRKSERAE